MQLTSGLCEVQNLRHPTNFEFGRGTNFAWQNSEAVVPNRISPVMLFDHTKRGQISSEKILSRRILRIFENYTDSLDFIFETKYVIMEIIK